MFNDEIESFKDFMYRISNDVEFYDVHEVISKLGH